MRIRTTAAAVGAVLALALTACSSSDEPEDASSSSAPASPSVDTAAAEQACKDAWRQAVEDGSIDDGSVTVEKPPTECEGVQRGAQMGAEAIRENIAEGRQRLEDCMEDPSAPECEGLPIP